MPTKTENPKRNERYAGSDRSDHSDGRRKIAAIVPEETRLSGYTEIDLQGKYIMPGLINMHVHLAGNGKPQKKQRDNAKLVKTLMSNRISRAIAYRMVAGFAKMNC